MDNTTINYKRGDIVRIKDKDYSFLNPEAEQGLTDDEKKKWKKYFKEMNKLRGKIMVVKRVTNANFIGNTVEVPDELKERKVLELQNNETSSLKIVLNDLTTTSVIQFLDDEVEPIDLDYMNNCCVYSISIRENFQCGTCDNNILHYLKAKYNT